MHEVDEDTDDRLEDMIYDIGESSFMKAPIYDTLRSKKNLDLYKGCTSFAQVSRNSLIRWTNATRTLEDNNFLYLCYDAKKILCPMSFGAFQNTYMHSFLRNTSVYFM